MQVQQEKSTFTGNLNNSGRLEYPKMKNIIVQNKSLESYKLYDKIYFITTKIMGKINRYIFPVRRTELTFILEHISDENLKVLDYGCATGHFAARIKRRSPSCEIHATDINPYAIEHGRQTYMNIKFWELDDRLFAERDFDVIVLSHVLEHISERKALLTRITSMLKNKGLLIIAVPQERIRGDATLVQLAINALRGNFKNPHLVKINYQDLNELCDYLKMEIKHSIYTNYLPPIRSKTRKWHAWSLVIVAEKTT